jgi:hypothetical protein
MDAYDLCSACACHIKTEESNCPFCGASHAERPRTARRWFTRVSRAQWLAFGSALAAVGCSGEHSSVSSAQEVAGGATGACGVASATFVCHPYALQSGDRTDDGGVCKRATQYCQLWPGPGGGGCLSKDDPASALPVECRACPTCSCVMQHGGCSCVEFDDAGGIGMTCTVGCYGSPPARLERLLASDGLDAGGVSHAIHPPARSRVRASAMNVRAAPMSSAAPAGVKTNSAV